MAIINKSKYQTREQWLEAAVEVMTPLFKQHGYDVPKVRVACGWPSTRALSNKRALGEAWSSAAAKDKVAQIFISPYIEQPVAEYGVLPVLAHEIVHAVVGNKEGHNKVFGKCARAIGLEGKLTSTSGSKQFLDAAQQWVETKLGAYPHSQLNSLKRPTKKQTTRMVKCKCTECGYTVRTSRKWLDDAGAPLCPVHKKAMKYEIPDELDGDGDDE